MQFSGKKYRVLRIFSIIILSCFMFQGVLIKRADYRKGMHRNVCKDLSGSLLIYYVFVDTKETLPWTQYDMQSTIDSVSIAVNWLQKQAMANNIPLQIKTSYYIGNEFSTINKNLPMGSVQESISQPNLKTGISELNNWADFVTRKIGESLQIMEKDGVRENKNPRNKERLIAYLRDDYNVESVALLFMVNNYFRKDISVALNTFISEDVEFAIISYKYPSVIAHNILNLFGAVNLYDLLYKRNESKTKMLKEKFPDEIMHDVYGKDINQLKISDLTKYLIGWKKEINKDLEIFLTDKLLDL